MENQISLVKFKQILILINTKYFVYNVTCSHIYSGTQQLTGGKAKQFFPFFRVDLNCNLLTIAVIITRPLFKC